MDTFITDVIKQFDDATPTAKTQYVVIGIENHPDRFISDTVYGPFSDFDEAWAFADKIEKSEFNRLKTGHRQYDYHVRELTSPPQV